MTYNGWTNYETWLVNLWLANDAGTVGMIDAEIADRDMDTDALAGYLAGIVDEIVLATVGDAAGLATDLLNAAVASVEWREIAEAWLDK